MFTKLEIFNRFAGREVAMTETEHSYTCGGKTYTHHDAHPADEHDSPIQEMRDVAHENGVSFRAFWGNTHTISDDFNINRVNAFIEKNDDGKWRVSPIFKLG